MSRWSAPAHANGASMGWISVRGVTDGLRVARESTADVICLRAGPEGCAGLQGMRWPAVVLSKAQACYALPWIRYSR
jgi:hypothetical protein